MRHLYETRIVLRRIDVIYFRRLTPCKESYLG